MKIYICPKIALCLKNYFHMKVIKIKFNDWRLLSSFLDVLE